MRTALVTALVDCVDECLKSKARRFLQGLSADELQFIAAFWGAWVLEARGEPDGSRAEIAQRITELQMQNEFAGFDSGHKLILLREYLCRSGVLHSSFGVS